MTPPPGSIPEKPIKNTLHHQVILAIIGIILLTAFLIIFIAAGFIGQNGYKHRKCLKRFFPGKWIYRVTRRIRNAGSGNYHKNGNLSN